MQPVLRKVGRTRRRMVAQTALGLPSPSPDGEEGLFLDYDPGGPWTPQFSDRTSGEREPALGSGGPYTRRTRPSPAGLDARDPPRSLGSMRKLYGTSRSRASRSLVALEEMGLDYEHVPIIPLPRSAERERLLAIN